MTNAFITQDRWGIGFRHTIVLVRQGVVGNFGQDVFYQVACIERALHTWHVPNLRKVQRLDHARRDIGADETPKTVSCLTKSET